MEIIMKKSYIDLVMNPTRSRIIQYLVTHKQATTSEISMQLKDVSKATLYRNISTLEKNRVLYVIEEHKIRGTVEKVYTLNQEMLSGTGNTSDAKTNAWNFLLSLYRDFDAYFDKSEAKPISDRIFFNTLSLSLSNEDFDSFMSELQGMIERYNSLPTGKNSKARKLTVISSPGMKRFNG
jgi:DNA-binding transcriptional ArsR family regulator